MDISLVQLDIVLGDPERNVRNVERLLPPLSGRDLVVLPELWSTGYCLAEASRHGSKLGDGVMSVMSEWSRRFSFHLAGSVLEEDAGAIYNTHVLASPEGKLDHYRKIHLFGPMNEPMYLRAGDRAVVVDAPWGRTGLAVCYDLRFPALFQTYAVAGARVLIVVAEWPAIRIEHWRTLLRARAIETQSFVVACNRVGSDSATLFGGHSVIIDPWGETIAEAGVAETVVNASIDLALVEEVRRKIPVMESRRDEACSLK